MIYTLPHTRNVISVAALIILRAIPPLFTPYDHTASLYYAAATGHRPRSRE